jgi:hypothetical protein
MAGQSLKRFKRTGAGFKNFPKNSREANTRNFSAVLLFSGGRWSPKDCKADQKVAFIIPYR